MLHHNPVTTIMTTISKHIIIITGATASISTSRNQEIYVPYNEALELQMESNYNLPDLLLKEHYGTSQKLSTVLSSFKEIFS